MFQKTERKNIKLTPRIAEQLSILNTFKGQRPISTKWVNDLANSMREGLFLSGHVGLAIYKNNGASEKYLVNGQHQLQAAIISKSQPDIIYEEYLCETMDDVSLLYRQFDNHKTRSLQNLVGMEMEALGLTDWPVRIASLIVTGAAMKEGLFGAHKNVKVQLLKKYIGIGKHIKNLFTDIPEGSWQKETNHLRRGPVLHAMLLTLEKSQADSKLFWVDVRDGEGLNRAQAQYKLREFLKESNFDRGRGASGNNRRTVSQHEMTSRCITAWNAFRTNSKTRLTYYPGKPIPKAV